MDFDAHRLSFGAIAAHYDRSRPTYPRAALTWALGTEPVRVVDLGAGTGLLTRAALALNHDVIPVEPDPGMRAQLDAVTPGVTALAGSAERIPLPDSSVDAVIAGQAHHWFDTALAHPEIARVLKPGGVFAPMWNDRDTDIDWTVKFEEILDAGRFITPEEPPTDFGPLFTDLETETFRHSTTQTPQGLCDLVASRSYFVVAPPEVQADLLDRVRTLCATHPALQGRDTFEMPYITVVLRAFKR